MALPRRFNAGTRAIRHAMPILGTYKGATYKGATLLSGAGAPVCAFTVADDFNDNPNPITTPGATRGTSATTGCPYPTWSGGGSGSFSAAGGIMTGTTSSATGQFKTDNVTHNTGFYQFDLKAVNNGAEVNFSVANVGLAVFAAVTIFKATAATNGPATGTIFRAINTSSAPPGPDPGLNTFKTYKIERTGTLASSTFNFYVDALLVQTIGPVDASGTPVTGLEAFVRSDTTPSPGGTISGSFDNLKTLA